MKQLGVLVFLAVLPCLLWAYPNVKVSDLDDYLFGDKLSEARNTNLVDSLRTVRKSDPSPLHRIEAALALGDYFIEHRRDSTLVYWNLALSEAKAHGLARESLRIRMRMDSYLPLVSMGTEAVEDFAKIDYQELDSAMRRYYFLAASELFYNLQLPYPQSSRKGEYLARTEAALDSLLGYYEAGDPVARYIQAHLYELRGDHSLAVASFAELLPDLDERPDLYARAAYILAQYYKGRPERRKEYVAYLVDMTHRAFQHGVVRPNVLAELGKELCDDGDYARGRSCLILALGSYDAEDGVFKLRRTNDFAHYLVGADERFIRRGSIVIGLLVLAFAVVLAFLVFCRRKARRRGDECRREAELAVEKAEHMRADAANFLALAFLAADQLRDFNKYVHRKLTAGQVKDLFSDVEASTYVRSQTERFFEEFDKKFHSSHPDFIERLNSLLREDARFEPLATPRLSPELRIAALMMLGVGDSGLMARVLGLSLNTVYTYRNRLKGRAENRAEFENMLVKVLG